MDKVKFAIVGCGNIGKRHVAVVEAEPNAETVAICDSDSAKLDELASLYPHLKCYTDYQLMLEEQQLDIVSIATPHGLHASMSIAASNKGVHSLVEKPMALSTQDCDAMNKAAKTNNVKLFVVKQNRYNVPIKLVNDAITKNKLGKVYMVQCNVLWNRHGGYYSDSDWRGDKSLEGGALHTQVSHFIDLLIWWFGDLEYAKTITKTLKQKIEIEDCGVSALSFKSGVMGALTWTTCVYNKNYEGSITIIAEKGTIKIGGSYLNEIELWDVESFPLPDDIKCEDEPNVYAKYQGTSSNHDKVIRDISLKMLKFRRNVVEGDEGLKTIAAIEQIYGCE